MLWNLALSASCQIRVKIITGSERLALLGILLSSARGSQHFKKERPAAADSDGAGPGRGQRPLRESGTQRPAATEATLRGRLFRFGLCPNFSYNLPVNFTGARRAEVARAMSSSASS